MVAQVGDKRMNKAAKLSLKRITERNAVIKFSYQVKIALLFGFHFPGTCSHQF
jgi:hypothetical protein